MESFEITPVTAYTICRSLVSVVEGGFGRRGLKTMICSATGKVLVTADGRTILEALNLSHPLAKTIVKSASTCSITAGGCKTFLLYITGALEAAEKALMKHQGIPAKGDDSLQSRPFRLELSHGIQRLLSQYLVQGLTDSLKSCFLQEHRTKMELQIICSKLLKTELSAHFTPGLSDIFTQLLVQFVFETVSCVDEVQQDLDYLVENYSDITIKIPNQPYTYSTISHGVLIRRSFACELPRAVGQNIKFVVLKCNMEGVDTEIADGHMVHIQDAGILEQSLELKQRKAKYLLEKCLKLNVQLVLSTEKSLESFLFLCRQNSIAVIEFVSKEIAERLTLLCGIEPLYGIEDLAEDHICLARSCLQMQFGRTTFIDISVENPSRPILSRQIVICAPTDGLCDQSNDVLYTALKTLSTAFDRSSSNSINLNSFSSQNRGVLIKDATEAGVGVQENDDYPIDTASHFTSKTTQPLGIKLFTIPSGGTFEYFVEDFLNSVQSDTKDAGVVLACAVIKKAVGKVPFSLYSNACSSSTLKMRHRLYLELHKEALQNIRNKIFVGINYRTGNLSLIEEALETVSGKISTLFNAIQLLTQILKTDSIVSVKRLPQTSYHGEPSEDDWE